MLTVTFTFWLTRVQYIEEYAQQSKLRSPHGAYGVPAILTWGPSIGPRIDTDILLVDLVCAAIRARLSPEENIIAISKARTALAMKDVHTFHEKMTKPCTIQLNDIK